MPAFDLVVKNGAMHLKHAGCVIATMHQMVLSISMDENLKRQLIASRGLIQWIQELHNSYWTHNFHTLTY